MARAGAAHPLLLPGSRPELIMTATFTSAGSGGSGTQGPPGKSAYDVAVLNGFVGSVNDWLASLVGATGSQGPPGAAGATGSQGPAGATGPAGSDALGERNLDKATGYITQSMDRRQTTNVAGLSAGVIQVAGWINVKAGVPITSIAFCSGATAVATPTNQWFGLVDLADKIVAVTADDGSAAWSANQVKVLSIASGPYTPSVDAILRGLIMVAAATPPSFAGVTGSATANAAMQMAPKSVYRDTGSGRTTPVAVNTTLTPNGTEFRIPWFGIL